MPIFRSLLTSCATSLCLMATTAAADLSAAQVWGDWRSYLEGLGYSVTATESASGGTLSVSDIAVQIATGPDTGDMTVRMGSLQFVEGASGTVTVLMPQTMPLVLDIAPSDGEPPVRVALDYTQRGQSMIASGDAAALIYDYTADAVGLAMISLTVGAETFAQTDAQFAVTGEALRSQTRVTGVGTRSYAQNMQLGNVAYDLFFKDPEDAEAMRLNSTLRSLAFTGTTSLPAGGVGTTTDIAPLLAAGFAFDGMFTSQGSENRIEITSEEGTSKIKTGSATTTLGVAMAPVGMRYDFAAEQVEVGAELAGLPFPLFAQMARTGFALRAPLMKSEAPQDFSLAVDMTDFTMSDMIWAMFDPSNQLPRDPATVALDLNGKAKVLFDTLDPEKVEALAQSGALPGELNALTIERLTVDAIGARLDAKGAFTFDNTDTTTLPGFPKPVGDLTINIAGANALLDKLVAIGLLPAEQVMGARMMLGLFAVPGDAPDTLKSRIEFNEAGQILANGQRIK
jgi:hypothetical protein